MASPLQQANRRPIAVYAPGRQPVQVAPRTGPNRVQPGTGLRRAGAPRTGRAGELRDAVSPWSGFAERVLSTPAAQNAVQQEAREAAEQEAYDSQSNLMKGLGWVIGNPVTQNVLKPLGVLGTAGRAVTYGVEQLAESDFAKNAPDWLKQIALATGPGQIVKAVDTERTEADDRSFYEKVLKPDSTYGYGELLDPDNPQWVNRIAGFAGDVGLDPLTYLTAGTAKLLETGARAEKAADVAKLTTKLDEVIAGLDEAATAKNTGRFNALATEAQALDDEIRVAQEARKALPMTKGGPRVTGNRTGRLAEASKLHDLPQEELARLAPDILRMTERGVGTASPALREALGWGPTNMRFMGMEIPKTGGVARGVNEALGLGRVAVNQKIPGVRNIGRGVKGTEVATEGLIRGTPGVEVRGALTDVQLSNLARVGEGGVRGPGKGALRELARGELRGSNAAAREALTYAAETQPGRNVVNDFFENVLRLYEKTTGVEYKYRLKGMEDKYVPHVLTNQFRRMLQANKDNPLVQKFVKRAKFNMDDLLEGSNHLERSRQLRPNENGTARVINFDDAGEITIQEGTIRELNEELKKIFPSFKGKFFEDDIYKIGESYVDSIARGAGADYAKATIARSANPLAEVISGDLLRVVEAHQKALANQHPLANQVLEGYKVGEPLAPVPEAPRIPGQVAEGATPTPEDLLAQEYLGSRTNKGASGKRLDEVMKRGKRYAEDLRGDIKLTKDRVGNYLFDLKKNMMEGLRNSGKQIDARLKELDKRIIDHHVRLQQLGPLTEEALNDWSHAWTIINKDIDDLETEISKIRSAMDPEMAAEVEHRTKQRLSKLKAVRRAAKAKIKEGPARLSKEIFDRTEELYAPYRAAQKAYDDAVEAVPRRYTLEGKEFEYTPAEVAWARQQQAPATAKTPERIRQEQAFAEATQEMGAVYSRRLAGLDPASPEYKRGMAAWERARVERRQMAQELFGDKGRALRPGESRTITETAEEVVAEARRPIAYSEGGKPSSRPAKNFHGVSDGVDWYGVEKVGDRWRVSTNGKRVEGAPTYATLEAAEEGIDSGAHRSAPQTATRTTTRTTTAAGRLRANKVKADAILAADAEREALIRRSGGDVIGDYNVDPNVDAARRNLLKAERRMARWQEANVYVERVNPASAEQVVKLQSSAMPMSQRPPLGPPLPKANFTSKDWITTRDLMVRAMADLAPDAEIVRLADTTISDDVMAAVQRYWGGLKESDQETLKYIGWSQDEPVPPSPTIRVQEGGPGLEAKGRGPTERRLIEPVTEPPQPEAFRDMPRPVGTTPHDRARIRETMDSPFPAPQSEQEAIAALRQLQTSEARPFQREMNQASAAIKQQEGVLRRAEEGEVLPQDEVPALAALQRAITGPAERKLEEAQSLHGLVGERSGEKVQGLLDSTVQTQAALATDVSERTTLQLKRRDITKAATDLKASAQGKAHLGNTRPDQAKAIDDLTAVVRENPLMDDATKNATESLLHSHLADAKRVAEGDIRLDQVNAMLRRPKDVANVAMTVTGKNWDVMHQGPLAAGDIIIQKELHKRFQELHRTLTDEKWLGRTFNAMTNLFKTYATLSPGFHVRNALSAIFMNASDGVRLSYQFEGVHLWRQYMGKMRLLQKGDPLGAKWLAEQPEDIQKAFAAVFASGAGGRFTEAGVTEATGQFKFYDWLMSNRVTRASQRGGERVEGAVRLGMALDSIRAGDTVDGALQRITRIHFDYSQLSRADENIKRFIPFWTFMSRNMPLQVTQMWSKPKAYLIFDDFKRNFASTDEPLTPEYWKEAGSFNTGFKTPSWTPFNAGGLPISIQPDLGFTRIPADLADVQKVLSGENWGAALANFNPLVTAPLEYMTGQDFYTGRKYGATDYSTVGGPIGALMKIPATITGDVNEAGQISEKFQNSLRAILPMLDRSMRLAPQAAGGGNQDKQRVVEAYARFAGLPVHFLTPGQQRSEAYRRYYDQRDETARLRAMVQSMAQEAAAS